MKIAFGGFAFILFGKYDRESNTLEVHVKVAIAVELCLETEEGVGVLEEETDVCQTALRGKGEMNLKP